ncbi:MAG: hypothetical protein F4Y37_16825 [Caldilineaceae bacterium SB0664_bin_22]|nr:hypothetical protein [Caldilineaceae bacterium SB0664_bin_22]MYC63441.1 hypothetical protein [Caldilineaceae bacterium SB0661_bin_34]
MQETTTTRHRQADDRERSQDLAARFHELAEQWEHDTFLLSNTGQALAHPAHVAIVGLGIPSYP